MENGPPSTIAPHQGGSDLSPDEPSGAHAPPDSVVDPCADEDAPHLREPAPGVPDEPYEVLIERGLELVERGVDLESAREALERAAAMRFDDADVASGLGLIYGRRALDLHARSPRALLHCKTDADLLLSKAILFYQRAVELDSSRTDSWNNLATLYAVRGDRELAIDALKRSLKAVPDQPAVRERLDELGAL